MKKPVKFLSVLLSALMVWQGFGGRLSLKASAQSVENLSVTLGASTNINGTYHYQNAAVTGSNIKTIMLSFSGNVVSGDNIVLPDAQTGFAVSTTSAGNNYNKRINIADGADAAAVQSYLRSVGFTLDGTHTLQSVKVTITTEDVQYDTFYSIDTQHYYQYIKDTSASWITAYSNAKAMTYMGRSGYLATITSKDEDTFVNTLSGGKVGWLGGTILKNSGNKVDASDGTTGAGIYYSSINITGVVGTGWYWACGPEIGTTFYNVNSLETSSTTSTAATAATVDAQNTTQYYNWARGTLSYEPNNKTYTYPSTNVSNYETCLTTLQVDSNTGKQGTAFSWNDKHYDTAGTDTWSAKGYFVEYGNMTPGDSSTSATGYASAGGTIDSADYAAAVSVKIDGAAADAPGSIELRLDDQAYPLTETGSGTGVYTGSVPAQKYDIYTGGKDTGTDITVSSGGGSAEVDFSKLSGTASITGSAVYGQTLTASLENGNNTGAFSYQWTRDGNDISGAAGQTYTLIADDIGCAIAVKITSSVQLGTLTSTPVTADSVFSAMQGDSGGNYVKLSWTGKTGAKFMVAKSSDAGAIYQTIPLKTDIKVLNIYPCDDSGNALISGDNRSDSLKSWMKTYGNVTVNGKSYTMNVENISFKDFNANNASFMKDGDGNYKYDVVYFGAWDRNGPTDSNNETVWDLNDGAAAVVENFIKCGGGCLFGHDTASFMHSNFIKLASTYLNMQVSYRNDTEIPTYGDTTVVVSKRGSLMNYPYELGNVGNTLTVPLSHSFYEFASGDVWFKYQSDTFGSKHNEVSAYGGKSGTNNFYLTTWNNAAMIQTGHSCGDATTDEQQILANTLYYLAQVTDGTSADDHTAQDFVKPDAVSSGSVTQSIDKDGKMTIKFADAKDNGSTYDYKLYALADDGTKPDTDSGVSSATVTTGIKGYAVKVDQNSSTTEDPGNTVNASTPSFDAGKLSCGIYYAHIKAIDNAGNASAVTTVSFDLTTPSIKTGSINLTAIDEDSDGGAGQTVSDLLTGNVDGVSGHTYGIAVTAADNTEGQWQYYDTGSASWDKIPNNNASVTASSAMFLSNTTKIRLVPNPNYNGSDPTITYKLWDEANARNTGDRVDVSAAASADSSYSYNEGTIGITVNAVNDPPSIFKTGNSNAINFTTANAGTTGSYLSVPDMKLNQSFTVEGWVYARNKYTFSRIFDFGGDSEGYYNNWLGFSGSDGTIELEMWPTTNRTDSTHITSKDTLELNKWVHVAVVYDYGTKTAYIYFNGVLEAKGPMAENADVTRNHSYFGRSNWPTNDKYFDGEMKDISLWNTAKTQSNIQSDMSTAPTGSESGLVAAYNLTEGSGSAVNDCSPNGNNATMNGSTWDTNGGYQYNVEVYKNSSIAVDKLAVTDIDGETGDIELTLAATTGNLTILTTDGLTSITGNGTPAITVKAPMDKINAALKTLSYKSDTVGDDTVTATINDLGNTGKVYTELKDTKTVAVNVLAIQKPDAPSGITVTSSDGNVTAGFDAPLNNGGSTVTGYTVSATPVGGGAAITASGTGTSIPISLIPGTEYTITVTANNSESTSDPSTAADFFVPSIDVTGNATEWTKNDVTLTVTAKAASGDTKTVTVKKPDGSTETFTGSSYDVSENGSYVFTLTTGSGTATKTVTVDKIDKAAPDSVDISADSNSIKSLLNTLTFGLFFKDTVDVTITASDNNGGSGVDHYEYQLVDAGKAVDSSGWKTAAGGKFSISPQFKGEIYARAVDKAGNTSDAIYSKNLVKDSIAPNAPASVAETVNGSPYDGSSFTTGDVKLVAAGSTALSGIKYYEYKIGDSGPWTTMTDTSGATDATSGNSISDTVTINTNVDATIHIRAVSNSGLVGKEATVTVKRDDGTPTIAVGVKGDTTGWTKEPVTFTLSTSGSLSESTYYVKIGTGDWQKITGNSYTISDNISTTYQFKSVSESGTESVSQAYTVKIENTAPNIKGVSDSGSYSFGRSVSPSDSGEIASATYSKDGGSATPFANGQFFSEPGTYTITVTNKAGNTATVTFTVNALPSVSNVVYTTTFKDKITELRNEFNSSSGFPEPYRTNTDNAIKALEDRYAQLQSGVTAVKTETDAIKDKINGLNGNDGLIAMKDELQSEYDKITGSDSTLTPEQKAALSDEANYLKQELSEISSLQKQVSGIKSQVAAINTQSDGLIAQKGTIQGILDTIKGLSQEQQNQLKNETDKLESLLTKIGSLESQADNVKKQIDNLPSPDNVKKGDATAVENADNAYNALNHEQKGIVGSSTKNKLDSVKTSLYKLMLYDGKSDTTVTAIGGTKFSLDTYLVVKQVTQIQNAQALTQAESTVTAATQADASLRGKELTKLYNVKLYKGNVTIEPDGYVKVKIKIPDDLKGRTGLVLIRVNSDGTVTDMNATRDGDYFCFITNHFSYYAILADKVGKTSDSGNKNGSYTGNGNNGGGYTDSGDSNVENPNTGAKGNSNDSGSFLWTLIATGLSISLFAKASKRRGIRDKKQSK